MIYISNIFYIMIRTIICMVFYLVINNHYIRIFNRIIDSCIPGYLDRPTFYNKRLYINQQCAICNNKAVDQSLFTPMGIEVRKCFKFFLFYTYFIAIISI